MMLFGSETERAVSRLLLYFSDPSDCPVAEMSEQACDLVAARMAGCLPVAVAVRIAASDSAFRQSCVSPWVLSPKGTPSP